jgi:hypothetical protein
MLITRAIGDVLWDPIGDIGDNGWGTVSCSAPKMLSDIRNASGVSAVVRRGDCVADPLMLEETETYYVFLIQPGESPARRNLVFRYESPSFASHNAPIIGWKEKATLIVKTRRNAIYQITARKVRFGGMHIEYDVAHPVAPTQTEWWQRSF